MAGGETSNRFTLAVYFKVTGFAAFLSHQETLRMFRRLLVRCGIELRYSEGFNPHPKLSLVLPRSVGMASDCELLLVGIFCDNPQPQPSAYRDLISAELPAEIMIVRTEIHGDNAKFIPAAVTYLIPASRDVLARCEKWENAAAAFNSGKPVVVERLSHKTGKKKTVNLSDFVESVNLCPEGIELVTKLVDGTSIRLDEMPSVFGLREDELNGAVVRRAVEWERK